MNALSFSACMWSGGGKLGFFFPVHLIGRDFVGFVYRGGGRETTSFNFFMGLPS